MIARLRGAWPLLARVDRPLLVELAAGFSVLYGISFWSVPCAFIIGGIAAIAAIEIRSR